MVLTSSHYWHRVAWIFFINATTRLVKTMQINLQRMVSVNQFKWRLTMRPPYQWGIRRSNRYEHGHRYDLSTPEQSPQKRNWRGHGPPRSPRCHRRSRWPMEAKRTASRLLEAEGLKYINAQEWFLISAIECLDSERGQNLCEHSDQISIFSPNYERNWMFIFGNTLLNPHSARKFSTFIQDLTGNTEIKGQKSAYLRFWSCWNP